MKINLIISISLDCIQIFNHFDIRVQNIRISEYV
jgi:hypothetical protein